MIDDNLVERVKVLEKANSANPSDSSALMQLAAAYWQSGLLDKASRCLSRLIEAEPNNASLLNNQGVCLQALQRPDEALACFERAVELDRRNFAYLLNLGRSLCPARRWPEAVPVLTRALEIEPNSLDCLAGLAEALQATGEIAKRDEVLNRLLRLEVSSLDQQITRASIFHNLDHSAQALDLINRVLDSVPDHSQATFIKGMILQRLGRHDESILAFEKTIRAQPGFTPPYFFLSQSKKFDERDVALVEQMEAVASSFAGPQTELAMLRNALGTAYNGLGLYENAIRNFDESNAISKLALGLQFDRDALQQNTSDILATFSRDEVEKQDAVAGLSQTPVFVLGMPRSGTTLTESILARHPEVAAAGELLFWQNQGARAVTFRSHLVHVPAAQAIGRNYLELIASIGGDATKVVDKNPFNFLHAGLIAKVLPGAKFLHCVRHPVDTCLSFWMSSFGSPPQFSFDRSNIVFFYRQYERLVRHWQNILGPERWLEVSYEDLVNNQETVSRKMVEFIGLEWDASCLQPEKANRVVSTASHWQARQPVYRTSLERWRRYEPWLGEFRELLTNSERG
jgi:tetratricopeptide (TPR) repeat protein